MAGNMHATSSTEQDSQHDGGWQTVVSRRNRKPKQKTPEPEDPNQPASLEAGASMESSGSKASDEPEKPVFARAHERDFVFSAARTALIDYNRQSLAHFTDPLRVEATTSEATRYSHGETTEVTLALVCRKNIEHFQFKLVRRPWGKNSSRDPHVPRRRRLEILPLVPQVQIAQRPDCSWQERLEQQQAWWSKNEKTFDFMRLPPELRDVVYKQAFPQGIYPVKYVDGPLPFGRGTGETIRFAQDLRKYDATNKIIPQPDLALIGVCRKVKSEVERFLDIETTKCFRQPCDFRSFLKRLGDPDKYNNLSHIELDFSHEDNFYFFHVEARPFAQLNPNVARTNGEDHAPTLRSLPHIKSLTLRFTSLFDAMRFDPWGCKGKYREGFTFAWFRDWNGNSDRDGFQTSC